MTATIDHAARAVAASGTEIVTPNPDKGPVSIESQYDSAYCVPGMLELIRAGEASGFDGYVVACFRNPGLEAAREIRATLGQPSVWINNAGIARLGSFDSIPSSDFQRVIAVGRLDKYFKEKVLLEQPWVRDDSITIAELVARTPGASVVRFARFQMGEA